MHGKAGIFPCCSSLCGVAESSHQVPDSAADACSAHPPLLEGFSDGTLTVVYMAGFRCAVKLRCASRAWNSAIAHQFGSQLRWCSAMTIQQLDLSTIDNGKGLTEVRCRLRADSLEVVASPIDVDQHDIAQTAVGVVDYRRGTAGPAWAVGPTIGSIREQQQDTCPALCSHCLADLSRGNEVHVMPLAEPSLCHVVGVPAAKYCLPESEVRMQHCVCSNDRVLAVHLQCCEQQETGQQAFLLVDLASGRHALVTAPGCPKIICRLTLTDNHLVAWQGEVTGSQSSAVNKDSMYLGEWHTPDGVELALHGDEWPPMEDESRGGTRWLASWRLPEDPWVPGQVESQLGFAGAWCGLHGSALEPMGDTVAVASKDFQLLRVDLCDATRALTCLDPVPGEAMGRAALARGAVVAPLFAQGGGGSARGFRGVAVWDPTSGALLRHVTAESFARALHPRCAVHCGEAPRWAGGPMEWAGARCALAGALPGQACEDLGPCCLGRVAAHPSRPLLALSLGSEDTGCRRTLILHFGGASLASQASRAVGG